MFTNRGLFPLIGCPLVSTIKFEVPEPTPATAALGGVPPAPSRSLYLRYLDLTDCTRLMDAGLHIIVKNCPHLQQLFLRRCVNITGKIYILFHYIFSIIKNEWRFY